MQGKLISWRPGCYAREGEECVRDGALYRFANGEWWRHAKDRWVTARIAPFLRSFPLPAPTQPRERRGGPVTFGGES